MAFIHRRSIDMKMLGSPNDIHRAGKITYKMHKNIHSKAFIQNYAFTI
jgi:hypothetical protein